LAKRVQASEYLVNETLAKSYLPANELEI